MKTTYFKTLAAILVTASAMAGFVSCERPDNTGNGNDDGQHVVVRRLHLHGDMDR